MLMSISPAHAQQGPVAPSVEAATGTPAEAPVEAPAPAAESDTQTLYEQALQAIADGRKSDARATLQRVIETEPLHAGAWLDLALIQCGLGNSNEAEKLFLAIERRFDPPQGIRDLISKERKLGCPGAPTMAATSVTLGRGIDRNVNQGASNPSFIIGRNDEVTERELLEYFLPKHDQYSVFSTEHIRALTPNGSIGVVQFNARKNDSLGEYDSASLFMAMESPFRLGQWSLRTNVLAGMVTLGGKLYQRQGQVQAKVGPPLPLPESIQFHMLAGVTRNHYLTLSSFNSTTYELRGQFTYHAEGLHTSASAAYLSDQSSTDRPGGSRHGASFNLTSRKTLGRRLTGELAYSFQSWNSDLPYSPGLIDQVRDQATHVLRGTMIYPIAKNQSLQLEARLVRNNENISIFQYNSRQLQLSWQWQHP